MDSITVTLSYSQRCHNRSFLKYCLFLAKYFFYVLLILFMDVVNAFFLITLIDVVYFFSNNFYSEHP